MGEPLSTGIRELDREIGGGIAPGSVVVVRTPPESQGELLLKELSLAHDTLYLTTTRTEEAVRAWLDGAGDPGSVEVRDLRDGSGTARDGAAIKRRLAAGAGWDGADRVGTPPEEVPADATAEALASFHGRGYVVIDPVDPLERRPEAEYVSLLHRLRDRVVKAGGAGVLHAAARGDPPPRRWLSFQFADAVWDVRHGTSHGRLEFRLGITKDRDGELPEEEIKLDLEDRAAIDVSRDIA